MASTEWVPVLEGRDDGRTWLGGGAVVLALVGFALTAGPLGVVTGVVVGAAWYLLPLPHAVALGHVALIAVASPDTAIGPLLVTEAGLLAILFSPLPREDDPLRGGLVLLLALAVLVGLVVLMRAWGASLPLVALALVAVAATLAYAIHRYELVALGLLEVSEA